MVRVVSWPGVGPRPTCNHDQRQNICVSEWSAPHSDNGFAHDDATRLTRTVDTCLLDCLEDSESSGSGTFGRLAMSVRCSLASQRLARYHSSDCWLTHETRMLWCWRNKGAGSEETQQPCRADDKTLDGVAQPPPIRTTDNSFHDQLIAMDITRVYLFLHAIARNIITLCQSWNV